MGLKKKKKPEVGSGFIKKTQDPTRNLARIKTRYPEITKIPYIYIHIYNLTLIPYFFSSNSELSSLPPSVRHSLSLISAQSHTLTLPYPHSHTPTLTHASLPQSDTPSPSAQSLRHTLSPTLPLPHSHTPLVTK